MKFKNLRWRPYGPRQFMLEAGDIVGSGGKIEWDGAYDHLLEPLDDEAKAAFAALRRGTPNKTVFPVNPKRDIYARTGDDPTRTGFDPTRHPGRGPFTGHDPKDRPEGER
jgi:hypothetical protein